MYEPITLGDLEAILERSNPRSIEQLIEEADARDDILVKVALAFERGLFSRQEAMVQAIQLTGGALTEDELHQASSLPTEPIGFTRQAVAGLFAKRMLETVFVDRVDDEGRKILKVQALRLLAEA